MAEGASGLKSHHPHSSAWSELFAGRGPRPVLVPRHSSDALMRLLGWRRGNCCMGSRTLGGWAEAGDCQALSQKVSLGWGPQESLGS